jgi:hypothetical protein
LGYFYFFKRNLPDFKFGLELEDLGSLFGAALGHIGGLFAARFFGQNGFCAAARRRRGGGMASIVGSKKGDRRFPDAIAIDLLHAHAHGRAE